MKGTIEKTIQSLTRSIADLTPLLHQRMTPPQREIVKATIANLKDTQNNLRTAIGSLLLSEVMK